MPERRISPTTMGGLRITVPGNSEMRRQLFADTSSANVFLRWYQKARADAAALSSDILLVSGLDELEDGLVARYRIDQLALHWDLRMADPPSSINREDHTSGTATADEPDSEASPVVVIYIPFSGAPGLFEMRPSNPPSEPAYGSVREAGLVLYWLGAHPDAGSIDADFDRQQENLLAWVSALDRDVDKYNTELRRVVRAAVKDRFDTLTASADTIAELGIPLRQHAVRDEHIRPDGRRRTVAPGVGGSRHRRASSRLG